MNTNRNKVLAAGLLVLTALFSVTGSAQVPESSSTKKEDLDARLAELRRLRDEYFKKHSTSPSPLEAAVGKDGMKKMGLDKLAETEQVELSKFFLRMTAGSTLANSAERYMEAQGYEKIQVAIKTVNFKSLLVVKCGPFGRVAYTEKPIGLSVATGLYWGKPEIIGEGIESLVDDYGHEHRFFLQRWTRAE